jgi:hypothetical protein
MLDHAPADAPDLAVMCEHMNAAVASPKKCAEHPTDDGNYDRAEKGWPEAWDLKTRHDLADEFQHQRIDDQNEETECHEN